MNRNKEIIKTSMIAIAGNLLLAAFKLGVGFTVNSVAIILDAVNNLSDSLSSVITIVATKLSEKEPDAKHPFGYGRIEHLSALCIGAIIFYVGASAVEASVDRILHPGTHEYTTASIVLLIAAVFVKLGLGYYTKRSGQKLDSGSLIASGQDSLNDSLSTAATLAVAIIYIRSGINIEGYIGLGISVIILKTGFEVLRDTNSILLGEKLDIEMVKKIRDSILTFPEVDSVFRIMINNHGRNHAIASAHIEVPEALRASWIDNLQRHISKKVCEDTGIEVFSVTVHATNRTGPDFEKIHSSVLEAAGKFPYIKDVYGFYIDYVDKEISFEVELSFDAKNIKTLREELTREISAANPGYSVSILFGWDYTD